MTQGYQPYYFDRDLAQAKRKSRLVQRSLRNSQATFSPDGVDPLPSGSSEPAIGSLSGDSVHANGNGKLNPVLDRDAIPTDSTDESVGAKERDQKHKPGPATPGETAIPPSTDVSMDVLEERLTQERDKAFAEGKASGYDEGLENGKEQGKEEARKAYHDQNEEAGLQLLEKIERELVKLALAQDSWFGRYAADVADLVTSIMRRLVPVYTKQFGSREIEAFVQQVLSMVVDKPRLEILLPPQSTDMAAEIKAIMNKAGAGLTVDIGNEPVSIRVDDSLQSGECIVRWQGGSVERRMDGFWEDIDRAIARMRTEHQAGHKEPSEASI